MPTADFLLISTAVFTGNELEPTPGAVAVCGNEIMAVGSAESMDELVDIDTIVLDLGDKLVMPGFNDSHLHFALGSVQTDEDFCVNLMPAKSEQECCEAVEQFAKAHPNNPWIYGQGWYSQVWNNPVDPTRHSLDALDIDRPICLSDFSMHVAWLNTKALNLLGITKDTPDPAGGIIRREADGSPNGILCEPPATDLALNVVLDVPDLESSLEKSMKRFNAVGITAVGDMYPRGVMCEDVYGTYQDMADSNRSRIRIAFFPDMEDIARAKAERRKHHGDMVRCGGVKLLMDGCVEAYTAFMESPYLNAEQGPAYRGEAEKSQEELNEIVANAVAAGFAPRIHAIGDGAAHMIVNAYEEAVAKCGRKGTRFVVEHTDNLLAEDIPRMNRLGISAAIQPQHPIGGLGQGMYELALGEERTSHMWRYREEIDGGVCLGLGTDWPAVMSINPIDTIYAAVTRSEFNGEPAEGYFRNNAISLGEALQAHTRGAAWVEGFEDRIGTLEEGKLADIVVLSCNPFDLDPMDLRSVKVVMTMFDGAIVYKKDK